MMSKLAGTPKYSDDEVGVLKHVCDRARIDGFAALSVGRIATHTGVRPGQVAVILAGLQEAGLLSRRCNAIGASVFEPSQVAYALLDRLQASSRHATA
jgi:DNA-binding IclR family transcriptional regulator